MLIAGVGGTLIAGAGGNEVAGLGGNRIAGAGGKRIAILCGTLLLVTGIGAAGATVYFKKRKTHK